MRFHLVHHFTKTILILSTILLSSCGGGGGGSTPSTSANQNPSTQASSSSSSSTTTTSSSSSSESGVSLLTIEEDSPALVAVYPSTAYKGTINGMGVYQGLANNNSTTPATSAFLNYSVYASKQGTFKLRIHYAFGGVETNIRDAWVYVNGAKVTVDTDNIIEFPYTGVSDGKWNTYAFTDYISVPLIKGDNDIRIVAVNTKDYSRNITYLRTGNGGTLGDTAKANVTGLPNIEALEVSGDGLFRAGTGSTVLYTLTVDTESPNGSIQITPLQDFYLPNTPVTISATANQNYKFDSWTGDAPSSLAVYTVSTTKNLNFKARFVSTKAVQPPQLVGFGGIQSDTAIPYTLTGGLDGRQITVKTLSELKTAMTYTSPQVITVSGLIDNSGKPSESLNVPSNTTIYGDPTNQGHLKNIELKLSGTNYIIRNLILSEVVSVAIKDINGTLLVAEGAGNDAISINGGKHIWIDHCEIYSTLTPKELYDFSGPNEVADGVIDENDAKDFYDGLIDIKNGATFITLSNNYLHDHWKAILIGSSDTEDNNDSKTRITLHHNYFKDIVSRIPLLRYGKGHFYNNYIWGSLPTAYGKTVRVDTIFNLRQGAQGLIEGNYVQGTKYTFGYFYTSANTTTGFWNLKDNAFIDVTNPVTTSTGSYTVPYSYALDASTNVNTNVKAQAGVGKLTANDLL